MIRMIIMGAQGAGKGTIAGMLKNKFDFAHISTGDMFREAIKNQTELGKKAKEIIDAGNLVPDEITVELVKERVSQPDCDQGFILDGFPRNMLQAQSLDKFANINEVVVLEVDESTVVERLGGRIQCKSCGEVYNKLHLPPKKEGVCDKCNGELYTRDDDKPDAIKNRLEIYKNNTEPLIDFYKEKGLVKTIDANPNDPNVVFESVVKELKLE